MKLSFVYQRLYECYGPQGWWPLRACRVPDSACELGRQGYHAGVYEFPQSETQLFEICVGAILTQNTSWSQVEVALENLYRVHLVTASGILGADVELLESLIRPTGYFRQKAKKLRIFSEFFLSAKGRQPVRSDLLALWGIGPETADSMLLYGYGVPTFVVDAYTLRILVFYGLLREDCTYQECKDYCEAQLERSVPLYQEMHALLVRHAKRFFSKRPYGLGDEILGG